MAGLISTGIWGFICSATMKGGQMVSTFVSGLSGWMIDKLGNAEFKTIYCRDKFVTNEFVYNRIRVTEDEEIISSSMKIASSLDNGDGTHTVYPDLREGDINPLASDDLAIGYYHNPANSGVIYAVQKITVQSDPDTDQAIIVACEDGSFPYPHMIIVRVGNLNDEDRQSFVRISSRTNCQYFYDGINSWAAYDDPEHVRCVLGKADMGLIPEWAVSAVGTVKRWFGLIADGVILRGIFILKSSNKTIEDEFDGVGKTITELETRFEIKEGQISSSVKEVQTYTAKASEFADAAKGFAGSAAGSASDAEKTLTAITEKESNITQTAGEITLKVSQIDKLVDDASGTLLAITGKESSINQTAEGITAKVTEVTKKAEEAAGSASDAAGSAEIAIEKASEVKQTAEGFQSTVTEVTTKAVTDAVTGATELIEEKVSTAVTQSAREWKVEVLGGEDTVLASINADESGIKIKGDKVEITGTLLAQIIMAAGLNVNDNFIVSTDGLVNIRGRLTIPFSDTFSKTENHARNVTCSELNLVDEPLAESSLKDFRSSKFDVSEFVGNVAVMEGIGCVGIILPSSYYTEFIGTEFTFFVHYMFTRTSRNPVILGVDNGEDFVYMPFDKTTPMKTVNAINLLNKGYGPVVDYAVKVYGIGYNGKLIWYIDNAKELNDFGALLNVTYKSFEIEM